MAQKRAPDVKTLNLQARVTPKEYKMVNEVAEAEHKTISQLIRELLYSRLEQKRKGIAA